MPGLCASACSLAFLGGVYRYIDKGSTYAVHRFSSVSGPSSGDIDTAQIVSAAIETYIREMGVDGGFFDLMVREGKTGATILREQELVSLNVINNGRMRPEWTIEAIEGGEYLRGVQDTVHGRGKAVFFCRNKALVFMSFYQAGAERAKSLASGDWLHSLLVDRSVVSLPAPVELVAKGGEVEALFTLTRAQAIAIAESGSVGHAMQLARDAPTFVGYRIDFPSSLHRRVSAFIENCVRR